MRASADARSHTHRLVLSVAAAVCVEANGRRHADVEDFFGNPTMLAV